MRYRLITVIGLFFCILTTPFCDENFLQVFGPSEGERILFTFPAQRDENAYQRAREFSQWFTENPPTIPVMIMVTTDDLPQLPVPLDMPETRGGSRVIRDLGIDRIAAVIVVTSGSDQGIVVTAGSKGYVTPLWLLESMHRAFTEADLPFSLSTHRVQLYRIGWARIEPFIHQWLEGGAPALQCDTNLPAHTVLSHIMNAFYRHSPQQNDRHYVVYRISDNYYFIGERTLVIIAVVSLAVMLLFVFVFSFIFGTASDQHIRDFLRVWWLPFVYLIITTGGLYAGQTIITWIFRLRFGNPDAWTLIPRVALAGKVLLSWFVINGILALNQLIRFPKGSFIYGYIGSLVCLFNTIVFSSIDFSLSIVFIIAYLVSFVMYHLKPFFFKLSGIIVLAFPFIPFIAALFAGTAEVLEPVYSGKDFWNVLIALFALPFQLFTARLMHSAGIFGRQNRFYMPFNLIIFFGASMVLTGYVLLHPVWSAEKPLRVQLQHRITETGEYRTSNALIHLTGLEMTEHASDNAMYAIPPEPAQLIGLHAKAAKFLERQLVTLTLQPLLPFQRIDITVETLSGIAVHDASKPFSISSDGQKAVFSVINNRQVPWECVFSADADTVLNLTAEAWTTDNPRGIRFVNAGITTDYLMEVIHSFTVENATEAGAGL